jgi:hypothetical protein
MAPDPTKKGGYSVVVAKPPWGPRGSLWDIAESVYGDGTKWQQIYDANRGVIGPDPNTIRSGEVLYLPALEAPAGSASTSPAAPKGGPPGPTMKLDKNELIAAANQLDSIAYQLDGKRTFARDMLNTLGNFAGDDDEGKAFNDGANGKPGYRAESSGLFTDVQAIVTAYHKMADGLRHMAATGDAAEDGIILSLPKVPE